MTVCIEAIRGEIIDDCALGRAAEPGGPIRLGLGGQTRSLRPYPALGDIWPMVARTAYAPLGYSPVRRHWLGKGGEWNGRIQQQRRA
jgi:hypothetical protein